MMRTWLTQVWLVRACRRSGSARLERFTIALRCACDHIERDDGDVIGLAEPLGRLRDVVRRLRADLPGTFEAEEFAVRVGGLDNAI